MDSLPPNFFFSPSSRCPTVAPELVGGLWIAAAGAAGRPPPLSYSTTAVPKVAAASGRSSLVETLGTFKLGNLIHY